MTEEMKQALCAILVTPFLMALVWFYAAIGTVYEEQVRCNNGATEYCMKGE